MQAALTATLPAAERVNRLRWPRIIVLILLAYEGLGGIAGGVMLVAAPDGHLMAMPVHILNGVFPDFLIPGIILFAMGVLTVLSFLIVLRKRKSDWWWSMLALGGWLIWFVTEIIVLQQLHWLHLMWGLPVLFGIGAAIPMAAARNNSAAMQKALLYCGMLSSLWYIIINTYVPLFYSGYNISSYTVSELSAIDAPTRILWILSSIPYSLLFCAFGWGVLRAHDGRALPIAGAMVVLYSAFGFYWPPMHMRGVPASLTDTLHIVWACITVLQMLVMMALGASALPGRFRAYSIISMILVLTFGLLSFKDAPKIPLNEPTPLMGVLERLSIGLFMVWIGVFGMILIKKQELLITN